MGKQGFGKRMGRLREEALHGLAEDEEGEAAIFSLGKVEGLSEGELGVAAVSLGMTGNG